MGTAETKSTRPGFKAPAVTPQVQSMHDVPANLEAILPRLEQLSKLDDDATTIEMREGEKRTIGPS